MVIYPNFDCYRSIQNWIIIFLTLICDSSRLFSLSFSVLLFNHYISRNQSCRLFEFQCRACSLKIGIMRAHSLVYSPIICICKQNPIDKSFAGVKLDFDFAKKKYGHYRGGILHRSNDFYYVIISTKKKYYLM